jgi:hypothetical protein
MAERVGVGSSWRVRVVRWGYDYGGEVGHGGGGGTGGQVWTERWEGAGKGSRRARAGGRRG